MEKLLSICVPCNKRVDGVRYFLNSIYISNSDVSEELYEVVLSDNDIEGELEYLVSEYSNHKNLHYYKTECKGFLNSYFVLKYAKGDFLLLHNSGDAFIEGALINIIKIIKEEQLKKSLVFFTNGMLTPKDCGCYNDFNTFMTSMSYWTSWSNGFSIWRGDFEKLPHDLNVNELFPHTSVLMTQWFKKNYRIVSDVFFRGPGLKKRGGHNKFKAFTIDYPSLLYEAYENGHISKETKDCILNAIMKEFLPSLLFFHYFTNRQNFEMEGYKENIKVYFPRGSYWITWLYVIRVPFRLLWSKYIKPQFNHESVIRRKP